MNSKSLVSAFALAASCLAGCAGADESTSAQQANLGAAPSGLAACGGRTACVDAFVLRALFNSRLVIVGGFGGSDAGMPAPEYVAKWLGATATRGTIHIKATPEGNNLTAVEVSLGDSDPDGATESGCWFRFALDGDTVIESRIEPTCAG